MRLKQPESLPWNLDMLTEPHEKASSLLEKYEALLKTVEREYADKLKTSEGTNNLVPNKVADCYEAQIKASEDKKKTPEKLKEMSVEV